MKHVPNRPGKFTSGPTPGTFVALKGMPDEPDRWGVYADGVNYLIATIENGAPGDYLETEEANARLFAASKKLLAACEHVVNSPNITAGDKALLKEVIAEAKGEAP